MIQAEREDVAINGTVPPGGETELIRTYLADRTIGCPVCHHNLRGASGTACPECGTALRLHLNTANARLGPWLLGVVAVAMPLGFATVLGVTGAIGAWRAWQLGQQNVWMNVWTRDDTVTLAGLGGEAVFCAIVLAFVIRRRGKFLAKSRVEHWVRAIALTVVMITIQAGLLYVWATSRSPW